MYGYKCIVEGGKSACRDQKRASHPVELELQMIVSLPVLCKTVCAAYQRTSRVFFFFFKFIIFCTDIIRGRGCDLSEHVSTIASTQTRSGLFGERA